MLNGLKNAAADILIASVDDLTDFSEVSVSQDGNSMLYHPSASQLDALCSYKDIKAIMEVLKPIYKAPTEELVLELNWSL